jgi:hypothetical protein
VKKLPKRKVPKDKKSGLPKKYLSGLKGSKRSKRVSLLSRIAKLYKAGKQIPMRLLKQRTKI